MARDEQGVGEAADNTCSVSSRIERHVAIRNATDTSAAPAWLDPLRVFDKPLAPALGG